MRILIIDTVCPKPYSRTTLDTEGLGGSEATVIRVAEGLASVGHDVTVLQHNIEPGVDETINGVLYSNGYNNPGLPEVIIVQRNAALLSTVRRMYPLAKLFLWCHDLFQRTNPAFFDSIKGTNTTIVTVSDWHKSQLHAIAMDAGINYQISATTIYNPIDDALQPDGTPVESNKMVFFSSPHKGLERTLKLIERFKDFPELSDVSLYIANPGYYPNAITDGVTNVVQLGPLPHNQIIQHVRSALCVLHLNAVFPETFGLVHAEANAVGTPFLTSNLGANCEISEHPAQIIDVNNNEAIIKRLIEWKTRGRPRVRARQVFLLKNVIKQWVKVIT